MPALALVLFLLTSAPKTPARVPPNVFAPIAAYQGTWRAVPSMSGSGADVLSNQCHRFTEYMACQLTVNGKVGVLVVYVPAGTAGNYYTQAILPQGNATGIVDLRIEGGLWTFSSKETVSGVTTYYRTTNDWHGNDHIHFEVAHSADGNTWVVDHQGDESRMAAK
ncbi:MAG: hypothetical protein ACYDC6_11150 [Acidobacteriaceae bacterium]